MRRISTALLLALAPSAALAEGKMPQMDFSNPLTLDQVGWMAVILVVLYLLLSRWGLPQMGKVLENRAAIIARDLAAARAAKQDADRAVALLTATLASARANAQAEVAKAVADAKAQAASKAAALNAELEAKLAESEARIEAARASAMAAIKPVAAQAASEILLKLTGAVPEQSELSQRVEDALAARKAA
ncbi:MULTISPECIES: F0F1 ATP synthase subunit B family protein [Acidocella]|uniref:F0F1 ATP synthase subunit B family protein n=1 Tax=Acidocella TaxID=50709 RepID=UPI00028F0D10|nr:MULTISPECIES: ATP synthase subunit b' [Acidocella]EKM98268.1 ATP synthase subunit b' [Acidocella sp. MX-AZ02]WBO59367.1 F0F1 ATP synthase subunit B [Acidocella sp. MX-AZ03]